jgi:molybdate-binding protein
LHLLARNGIAPETLDWAPRVAHAETELAAIIRHGDADVGLGIEAAARANGLAFIPLTVERLDIVMFKRDAFEPALQALFNWTRSREFAAHAEELGGYDVTHAGRVVLNT